MFEQAFKNIDGVLRKEAGCTTELDYTEQTSWLLFLKYLDGLEQDKAAEAALDGKKYAYILDEAYRWESWAAPKGKDGKLDHNVALTGDDLRDFVGGKLFPYLHGFKQRATGANTIEYKIGEIFGEIKNKIQSGYSLRDIIDHIDELRFRSQAEKHELSALYEEKIKRMGNAGRNGGEYYTPRPLIRAMVQVVNPQIGETIYDGAVGSAGFLCESFDYLQRTNPERTTTQDKALQERTFYGKEKKSLAYVIAIMNMILHGIEAPNILHTNTLSENLADIEEKDRYDVVLANPPFGGKERKEVQQNFPIRTGETAFLFLQHFIKMLKAGGRAGIVIKNTFLSNTDNAPTSLRKLLLESCNLHTVLDCPGGTFQGAGVKTVVLFFEKGAPTRSTWYYQLDPGRNLGKTNPLNDDDLAEFVELQRTFADSSKSWSVSAKSIDSSIADLSVKNPNGAEEAHHDSPQVILDKIATLDVESAHLLGEINSLTESHLQSGFAQPGEDWMEDNLQSLSTKIGSGATPRGGRKSYKTEGVSLIRSLNVHDMGFRYENLAFIDEAQAERLSNVVVQRGDVLLNITGASVARSCVVPDDVLPARVNQHVSIIRPIPEKLDAEFLHYLLISRPYKELLLRTGEEGGSTRQAITKAQIQEFRITFPRTLEEQRSIVANLGSLRSETQRLESVCQQKLVALDILKKSLLDRAFAANS